MRTAICWSYERPGPGRGRRAGYRARQPGCITDSVEAAEPALGFESVNKPGHRRLTAELADRGEPRSANAGIATLSTS